MAGDSEVNNPQKVERKLKVTPTVRETKAFPIGNESKEISKVKITKETPGGHILHVANVARSSINMT